MRVGFVVTQAGDGWLGAANYYTNLFSALAATPEFDIEAYVFLGAGTRARVPVTWSRVVPLRILQESSLPWLVRGSLKRLLGSDVLLERRVKAEGIEVVSHAELGRSARLPVITWISDVQHRHLPEFFPAADWRARDRAFAAGCRDATIVLASSEAARRDIEEFYPSARGRVRVLRFVHCSTGRPEPETDGVAARHGIEGPFLLLPNQFWAHKNHGLVVDALRILRERRERVVVVCTGNTRDYRQPGYFASLQARIREAGVSEQMKILGIVPYADLAALMRRAVAVVNPSLFEGWSTSVEEAKTLGKRVILSSIPVHREQDPERGVFFDPRDPEALAKALAEAWGSFDPEEERAFAERAAAALPARRRDFAATYAAIAREARELGPRRG